MDDTHLANDGRNVYIGGLNNRTKGEQIQKMAARCGRVEDCILLLDPVTYASRCVAFVLMSTKQEAQKLIENINGSIVDGHSLIVRLSDRGGRRSSNGTPPPKYVSRSRMQHSYDRNNNYAGGYAPTQSPFYYNPTQDRQGNDNYSRPTNQDGNNYGSSSSNFHGPRHSTKQEQYGNTQRNNYSQRKKDNFGSRSTHFHNNEAQQSSGQERDNNNNNNNNPSFPRIDQMEIETSQPRFLQVHQQVEDKDEGHVSLFRRKSSQHYKVIQQEPQSDLFGDKLPLQLFQQYEQREFVNKAFSSDFVLSNNSFTTSSGLELRAPLRISSNTDKENGSSSQSSELRRANPFQRCREND